MPFKTLTLFLALFLVLLSCSTKKLDTKVIVLPKKEQNVMTDFISEAQESIDIAVYSFENDDIQKALIQAKNRGIKVRVLLSDIEKNQRVKNALLSHGVEVKFADQYKVMHQKSMLLDAKTNNPTSLVFTCNFLKDPFLKSRDFMVLIKDKSLSEDLVKVYDADFLGQTITLQNRSLMFCPGFKEKLLNFITKAKNSLDIYLLFLKDDEIESAIADALNRNVKIRILFSPRQRDFSAINRLYQRGAEIRVLSFPFVHAKCILADHKTAFIGSQNFVASTFSKNRELALFLEDPSSIKVLEDTFEADFKAAKRYLSEISFNFYQ